VSKRRILTGVSLPNGLKFDEFEWTPVKKSKRPRISQAEMLERHRQNSIAKLRKMDAAFAESELRYLRTRCKALESVVAADRVFIERANEVEAELQKVRDYYASERAKELKKKS
jgi:hypothetical protein